MSTWQPLCSRHDLISGAGIASRAGNEQVAIFYLPAQSPEIYAIGNYDPIGSANVLSRGIVGDIQGELVVASPLYKQHFSLITGICIEDNSSAVPTWEIRLDGNMVWGRRAAEAQQPLHQTGT